MASLLVSAPDNYVTCPYDPTHRILWHRMPFHLTKCRKQHLLTPLQSCPFDTKHLVPQQEMHFHMFMCEGKAILEPDITSHIMQQESLLDEPQACYQVPESPLTGSAEEELPRYTPSSSQVRRKLPCQLKMDKALTKMYTLNKNEKEKMWDEDLHQSGIVVQPFTFGERSVNPDFTECRSYSLGGNLIPLRHPLNVIQITESRQARNPIVYSYAMNSVGIGRGAGRGRNMTTSESCCSSNLSISRIGSLGVGRARKKILH